MLSFITFAQENKTTNNHSENDWTANRPDGHAPIGVMGDHVHHQGEWMFSYRFMNMSMKRLKLDSDNVSKDEVFNQYMVAPLEMTMQMHMLGAMYAPTDKLTFMVMGNYISNDMDLQMRMMQMNTNFSTNSSGFGDISVSALYQFFNKNHKSLHAELGVVLPTGSIEEKDETPMSNGEEILLPYPMQIGSGSVSTRLGLTYLWQNELLSGGVQARSLIRLNENDDNYTLGNKYELTSWVAIRTTESLSFSLRGKAEYTDAIKGANENLMPMMVTTADTNNSGGFIFYANPGANYYISKGTFKNLRLATELILPVYQKLDGYQLHNNYTFTLGAQYSF